MGAVLVDSNVLLDVLTSDAQWSEWSGEMLARAAEQSMLVINPLIYAEVAVGFESIGYTLLLRDARRYRIYFPRLQLLAPAADAPGS